MLAHGSRGHIAFCPSLRSQFWVGAWNWLPLVGDPGDLFPKIQAKRSRVIWGQEYFLLETQGPGGPNIPQSCHGPNPLQPSSQH